MDKEFVERIGLTPSKGILIIVFFVSTVVAIIVQLPPSTAQNTQQGLVTDKVVDRQSSLKIVETHAVSSQSRMIPSGQTSGLISEQSWPKIAKERVASFDPFAFPAFMEKSETEVRKVVDAAEREVAPEVASRELERKEFITDLSKQGVGMLIAVDDEFLAVINGETYRVGDTVQGFRLAEITKNGIVLESSD